MMRYVVIATMRRGKVEPAEPLSEVGQALASLAMEKYEAACAEQSSLRHMTREIQDERDAPLVRNEGISPMAGEKSYERKYDRKDVRAQEIVRQIRHAYAGSDAFR